MGKKNDALLTYLEDNARFADLFNYFYFGGMQVVKPQELREASEVYVAVPDEKDGQPGQAGKGGKGREGFCSRYFRSERIRQHCAVYWRRIRCTDRWMRRPPVRWAY